jgi:hypothetical protein
MATKKHIQKAKNIVRFTEVSEFLTGKRFNIRQDVQFNTEAQKITDELLDLVAGWVKKNENFLRMVK